MDLKDQLKNLFPDHQLSTEVEIEENISVWLQKEPLICKYEKRKGKPITIIEGYTGITFYNSNRFAFTFFIFTDERFFL